MPKTLEQIAQETYLRGCNRLVIKLSRNADTKQLIGFVHADDTSDISRITAFAGDQLVEPATEAPAPEGQQEQTSEQ